MGGSRRHLLAPSGRPATMSGAHSLGVEDGKEVAMPVRKTRVLIAVIVVAAVLALVLWAGVSAHPARGLKLEGAWIARVTSFEGGPWPFLTQWSYVVTADPSGRRGTVHGSVDVPFPGVPGDYVTPIIGEVIQTGPETAVDNSIWYHVQKASPVNEIVAIGTAKGEWRWLGPDKVETTIHFAIYDPSADTNGDGIPEPDAIPLTAFTVTTEDRRLPLPR
jgi:hypothetical protein